MMVSGSCPAQAAETVLQLPSETRAGHRAFGAAAEGKHWAVSHHKAVMYLCKNVLLYKCMYTNYFFLKNEAL